MCGIAGLYRAEGVDPTPLAGMVRSLAARGPDDERLSTVGPAERPYAALGARRLAIVDLERGTQPIDDGSGRFLVSMNGEIFNHRSMHKQLEAQGHRFVSTGDIEVLANLFASNPRAPERCLERLHGMFAVAMVDRQERSLLLARDRMGEKPLYWTVLADGTLAWGSELKALRALPGLSWREDRRALQSFLLFEYIPAPWTAWEGVFKLEAGTLLKADASGIRVERWWTPPVPQPGSEGSMSRWAQSLRNGLQLATVQRLDADVEVGCLLSGGLDSSTVAALAQARNRQPLRTFSLSVDAPGFDEGAAARLVSAHLGTEHRSARLTAGELGPILDRVVAQMDEPLADSSLIATWRLMELVAEAGLKAVLSGDGADESFAGYPTCLAHKLAGPGRLLRGPLEVLLGSKRASKGGASQGGISRDYMARRFVQGLDQPWARRHQIWMGAWLPEEIDAGPGVWELVDRWAGLVEGSDAVGRALYLDQRLYLAEGVLTKVDRASMAHGVEVRCPFLDHGVVELAADMSSGMKLRGRVGKAVLREVARPLLPAETLARSKQGFGTPVGPWLKGPAAGLLDGLGEGLEDLIPASTLSRCIEEHRQGRADHRRRLWSALVLKRWREGRWGSA